MSTVVVATVVPLPGQREALVAAFEKAIPLVHAERGCERYALHESADKLVMIERWADDEAIQGHLHGAAFQELHAALEGKIEGDLQVMVLAPHPAGTAEQGAV